MSKTAPRLRTLALAAGVLVAALPATPALAAVVTEPSANPPADPAALFA